MKELLETLLEEFEEILKSSFSNVHRDLNFPIVSNMIQVATGMRRVGKSNFLFQTVRELLDSNVVKEQILYINFEDDRLLPMDQKQMGQLVDAFYSLYPQNHDRLCYLFFDEIQNIDGWQLIIRRLFDSKKVKIYLTGSSAKLLSKEIASSLRGRSITTEVWPYSLNEFFEAHKIPPLEKPIGDKKRDIYQKHLETYLTLGGFPAVQQLSQNEHRAVLQSYVDSVIFRDIIERYGITNTSVIKYLIKTLLKNCAAPFSVNKFYKDIKSQGYLVGKDTLYHYMNYIEDAFLTFSVPLFTESSRKIEVNPKKVYAIDTGLVSANLLASPNLGPLFENLIYLDLRRKASKIFYYKTEDDYEIDFIVKYGDGTMEMLQVVWDLSAPEVLEREQRALVAAEKELGLKGRVIDPQTYLRQEAFSIVK